MGLIMAHQNKKKTVSMRFILIVFSITVFFVAWGYLNLQQSSNKKLSALVEKKQLALYDIENHEVVIGDIDLTQSKLNPTVNSNMVASSDNSVEEEGMELLDITHTPNSATS